MANDKDTAKDGSLKSPTQRLDSTVRIYCAYNSSRQVFLCLSVETADVMPKDLKKALDTLTPESKKALWLVPFRGITASQVKRPIDLLFLDQNSCVLSLVESFPESHPGSLNWPVRSAIALPAGTISKSGTLTGDRLVLCSPEEMRRRFVNLELPEDDKTAISSRSLEDTALPNSVANDAHGIIGTPENQEPEVEDLIAKERDWLLCLISPYSREERMTPRESLPSITAYFFTGGAPAPAEVRNISSLGMYVITTERWYPGTIIRVTLSDSRLPPSRRRAITVNAMAVRTDEEGVGMRFVFRKPSKQKTTHPDHRVMVEITRSEVREFLQDLKRRHRRTT